MLVHPLVECVDDGHGDVGIVGDTAFEHAGERRPEQGAVDAHVLHEGQPRLRVEERVDARHGADLREAHLRITGCGLAVTLGDVTAVASRHSNLPERGVGDVLADLVPDGELGAAMDIDVLDNSLVLPGDELGESVPVLVEVVVGVEGRVGEASLPNVDEFLAGFAHC